MVKKATSTKTPAAKATAKTTATKAAAAAAKSGGTLLTVSDIADQLAKTHELPKSHARAYVSESIAMITKHLTKGKKVRIAGLGVFQVKKTAARKGRNPATGESIKIKAGKRVTFATARDLKSAL